MITYKVIKNDQKGKKYNVYQIQVKLTIVCFLTHINAYITGRKCILNRTRGKLRLSNFNTDHN